MRNCTPVKSFLIRAPGSTGLGCTAEFKVHTKARHVQENRIREYNVSYKHGVRCAVHLRKSKCDAKGKNLKIYGKPDETQIIHKARSG